MRCNNPVHNVTDMVSLSLSVFLISVLQMSYLAVLISICRTIGGILAYTFVNVKCYFGDPLVTEDAP